MNRVLSASFVVTIAAATNACSGKLDNDGETAPTAAKDASADSVGDAPSDGAALGCPTTRPKYGEACSGTVTCNYGPWINCGGGGYESMAACVNGQWSIGVMTCNPPAQVDAGIK